jgi:hypothetical protein
MTNYINGTWSNFGFFLKMDTETDDAIWFASSSNTNTSYRPKLIIEYSVPTSTPTLTPTQTFTPTATFTASSTPTETFTPTASNTPLPPTATHTATVTPSPSITPIPPTATHTSTPSATPTPLGCANSGSSSTWTVTGGTAADTCTDDATRHIWREPTSAGSSVIYSWPVTAGNTYDITFDGYYTGGHTLSVYCDSTSNAAIWSMTPSLTTDESKTATCQATSDTLTVIFYHAATGNSSHYLHVDYLNIAEHPADVYSISTEVTYGDVAIFFALTMLTVVIALYALTSVILQLFFRPRNS